MTPEEQVHRDKAEREASDDLVKTPRQLLYDIHDELLRFDRDATTRMSHAQKRLASLTVKNAEASDTVSSESLILQRRVTSLTENLHELTVWLKWLTIVILILTALAAYPVMNQLINGKNINSSIPSSLPDSRAKP
jgi:hypothetical protein